MSYLDSLTAKQKALKINLNDSIYGSFAEIGAGQEVVRFFFRVGGASKTIANAMSAYDKEFSDAKYGKEESGRYVCKPRLEKMLSMEFNSLKEILVHEKYKGKCFFSFSNTIATINFYKTFKGHGWLGVRFQLKPESEPNDFIIHVRLHDNDASTQQETIGILGVNMLYACYYYYADPKKMISSLYDELSRDKIEIDMIQLTGKDFNHVDNRLLSLQLVKNGMTDAVIFGPDGNNLHPSDLMYKKNILAIRGRFRPVTKVNIDMLKNGYKQFVLEKKVKEENIVVLFEMTLSDLTPDGDVDEKDFIDRAEILCSLGQTVLISNYNMYYKLVEYFAQYTSERMGLIMGVPNLVEILNEKHYRNLSGGILEACGILFMKDLKIYLYPFKPNNSEKLLNSNNISIHPRLKPLYDYLKFNGRIVDLNNFDKDVLHIFSDQVLEMIKSNKDGWENYVPTYVDNIIKEKRLFGYSTTKKNNLSSVN